MSFNIFISYARKDAEYLHLIEPTLKKLKISSGISFFYDSHTGVGENWDTVIIERLHTANAIICLLSTDYYASDYINQREIPVITNLRLKEAYVIPIFVRHCDPPETLIGSSLQGLNTPENPISSMGINERDKINVKLEKLIANLVRERTLSVSKKMNPPAPIDIQKNSSQRFNLVVVGRTGTGKSALVNYLYGNNVRESASGLPVTSRGFHSQNLLIDGIPSTIFDSWGLEIDNYEKWLLDLNSELSSRNIDKPINEWFHVVLYCISASSHRIEPSDINIIKSFREKKYNVVVVFTKSDLVGEETTLALTKAIHTEIDENTPCISICSVAEKLRSGIETSPFGLVELTREIQTTFWQSITSRVPSRCLFILNNYIDTEGGKILNYISSVTGFFNHQSISFNVKNQFNLLIQEITKNGGLLESVVINEIIIATNLYESLKKLSDKSIINELIHKAPDSTDAKSRALTKSLTQKISYSVVSSPGGGVISGIGIGLINPIAGIATAVVSLFGIKNSFRGNAIRNSNEIIQNIKKELLQHEHVISEIIKEIPVKNSL